MSGRHPLHTVRTALDALERSIRNFLSPLDDISDPRWRAHPDGEEWSLAETVEHVVLANRSVLAALRRAAESPLGVGTPRFADASISAAMFEGAPAPPGAAEPTGRFASRAEGVAALRTSCDAIVAWADAARVDLRAHGAPHPVFGILDGVQWILFAAAHTDNHAPQIRALEAATRSSL